MKNREFRTLVAAIMLSAMVFNTVGAGAGTVLAKEPVENTQAVDKKVSDSNVATSKDETVYAKVDGTGNVVEVTVSDILKNISGTSSLQDKSTLKDIENVKGDETFTNDQGKINWSTSGKDICYQGTTSKELPVGMNITYLLDGKKISAEDLKGKSGHLVIRYEYYNHSGNGSDKVPFIMVTGIMLDEDSFSNVKVNNGKVLTDGERKLAIGYGFPSMKEILGVRDINISESFELEADVTNFEMPQGMTVATNSIFNDLDTEEINNIDDLGDSLNQMQDAANQLVSGSGELKKGLDTLLSASGELIDGVGQLSSGAEKLKEGTALTADGSAQLSGGLEQASTSVNGLESSVSELSGGISQVATGAAQLDAGVDQAANGAGQVRQGVETLAGKMAELGQGAGQVAAGAAQVSSGINDVATGAQTLVGNIGTLETVASNVSAGVSQIANVNESMLQILKSHATDLTAAEQEMLAQYEAISAQASSVVQGASSVAGGLAGLNAGAQSLQAGVNQVVDGSSQVAAGAKSVSDGIPAARAYLLPGDGSTVTIHDGIAALESTLGENGALKNGSAQLSAALGGKIAPGAQQLYDGIYGTEGLASGLQTLSAGAATLSAGTSQVDTGAQSLKTGVDTLQSGSVALVDGVQKLDDGAGKLNDGMIQFNKDGVQKLVDVFDGDVKSLLQNVNGMIDASKSYKNFSGISENMDGEVKFIFVTKE